ncbi:Hypothetical predicted protein [Paramuricea clavata]|uniref:Uncharacterized protein n=1 Tax=Paramuricea clavata TaxID=317549 RepID=A0A6S7FVQ9_PARCT|nr:Hypothetical predicted protein [Paramuricea clavata]
MNYPHDNGHAPVLPPFLPPFLTKLKARNENHNIVHDLDRLDNQWQYIFHTVAILLVFPCLIELQKDIGKLKKKLQQHYKDEVKKLKLKEESYNTVISSIISLLSVLFQS